MLMKSITELFIIYMNRIATVTEKNTACSCRLSSGIRFMIPNRRISLVLRRRRHDRDYFLKSLSVSYSGSVVSIIPSFLRVRVSVSERITVA